MGDYDAFALQDEFGDDLDDIATEIAVLRRENARLRATIDNQSAEIGRLRELVCITSDALDHRTAWSGSCCMCTDEVCVVAFDDALAALEAEMADR